MEKKMENKMETGIICDCIVAGNIPESFQTIIYATPCFVLWCLGFNVFLLLGSFLCQTLNLRWKPGALEFPKTDTFSGGAHNKKYNDLGSMLKFPYLGKLPHNNLSCYCGPP